MRSRKVLRVQKIIKITKINVSSFNNKIFNLTKINVNKKKEKFEIFFSIKKLKFRFLLINKLTQTKIIKQHLQNASTMLMIQSQSDVAELIENFVV